MAAHDIEKLTPETRVVDLTLGQLLSAVRDMLNQPQSGEFVFPGDPNCPLGRKQLGEAARRRIAAGLPGAGRVGRRWCLSRAALAEELARLGRSDAPQAKAPDAADALRAELGGAL